MSKVNKLLQTIHEMSRGIVVLDENLSALEPYLLKYNMRIVIPPKGMPDEEIKHSILSKRILITNNSKDFVKDASAFEYGIIATEKVSKDPQTLAKMISQALSEFNLWSKQHGFILVLMQNGNHKLKNLLA